MPMGGRGRLLLLCVGVRRFPEAGAGLCDRSPPPLRGRQGGPCPPQTFCSNAEVPGPRPWHPSLASWSAKGLGWEGPRRAKGGGTPTAGSQAPAGSAPLPVPGPRPSQPTPGNAGERALCATTSFLDTGATVPPSAPRVSPPTATLPQALSLWVRLSGRRGLGGPVGRAARPPSKSRAQP